MNNRHTVSEFVAGLVKDEHDYSIYLDLASRDRPDLRPTYEMPQYLPLRIFKIAHTLYLALDLCFDYKLSRRDGDRNEYNESGQNKAVLNAISDFYKCTFDYEKHTKGLGNYTPIGTIFHLRTAVVGVGGVLHGAKRKEQLMIKANALEEVVTKVLAEANEAKPASSKKM